MKAQLFLCALLLAAAPAAAQEPDFETGLARAIAETPGEGFLTFSVENDMVAGTDRGYTSGVRATWFDRGSKLPRAIKLLDPLLPTISFNETTGIYYSLGHNIFSPKAISSYTQDPRDRPWAAFLYASAGLNTVTKNHTDNAEITIGVVGPLALGRPVQSFVHKYVSRSPEPRGWGNQLNNEPGLMLSWERSWPSKPYNARAFGWTASAIPHIGATLGNIYTYGNAGLSFRLAPRADVWQDDPVRVRPSIPGTGSFLTPDDAFSWYFFGGIETRAVARNIFLDGNTFTSSHRVDKKPLVLDLDGGIALTYGKARVSYSMIYRSREFDGQDASSVFGSVSLGYRF